MEPVNVRDTLSTVFEYHQRTKHQLQRYAAGPAGLDWDDQPEAFRWFGGAPRVELPLTADSVATAYADLFTRTLAPQALNLDNLAALLECSLGLAAWKQYGQDRWALRCNPSSGNLHPTEAYLVSAGVADIPAGVFHYLSRDHVLERRCGVDAGVLSGLLPGQGLLVGLTSIHWREAWKYGERAYRYCQLDAGHAIAALRYAAAALGWSLRVLDDWADADIAGVLGLDRAQDFADAEREEPDVMLLLQAGGRENPAPPVDELRSVLRASVWQGRANTLSTGHVEQWPVIDEVASACRKPRTAPVTAEPALLPPPLDSACTTAAVKLFRRRRSAQRFDGQTAISAMQLFRMLDMLLPRDGIAPWDSLPGPARLHPIVFVHRVEGLRPGLYVLPRRDGAEDLLREALQRDPFEWERVEGCPSHIPFYSLVFANSQRVAATLSCHQAIAADSAFAVAMLAEFETPLSDAPWRYRRLFQEAGVLGQVLYLEAEAAGVQGTGIGCFFDDPLHELLGIPDRRLQSLYHFTVGGAVFDHRLTTLPPYPGLSGRRAAPHP